jgi:hypothetical protein
LTQQPPSEQNGAEAEVSAEADAVADRKDNVSVIPMKVGGVGVRDRRTAEAEQAEDTNNTILTCCVVPTFANSHGISQRCSLVGQQGMNSAKGEGHPAAHSTAGSSCEGAAQQQAISGAATIHWVLRGGQHRGPVHQGCKQTGPGSATGARTWISPSSDRRFIAAVIHLYFTNWKPERQLQGIQ